MGRRTNTAAWYETQKRWQIKVQKNGERRTFTSSTLGRNGQRECNGKADAWLDNHIIEPNIRASRVFNNWMEELKGTTSRGHWSLYQSYWDNWFRGILGNLKVESITEQHIQDIINNAFKRGNLSRKTLQNMRGCLTAFIKYCRKRKSTALVVENVYIPRGAKAGERKILQPIDLKVLFTNDMMKLKGREVVAPYINAFRFEVTTGLRPGEVLGLKWGDLEDNVVKIRRSINKYNEQTKGKNENAVRDFALKPIDIESIISQKKYILASGIRSEYVFPDRYGEHAKQRNYLKHWAKYKDHNGLGEVSLYELRHTFISINKELPAGLIKEVVGHGVNMDTYGTYGHVVNGEMQRTAELIQKQFEKALEG